MHKFSTEIILPYSIEQLYNLIIDIDEYPEFLPWCSAARILEKNEDKIIAELVISFKAFSEKYTSLVTLNPPIDEKAKVDVSLLSGPFNTLSNSWVLEAVDASNTKIQFDLAFEFKSFILDNMMGLVFSNATEKMMEAFKKRASEVCTND